MARIPNDGLFRPTQSFTLITANQLLDKLRWDLEQLEKLRWEENLGSDWRRIVSYKAVECATSIWHLAEWFAAEIWAEQPRERVRQFLGQRCESPGYLLNSRNYELLRSNNALTLRSAE